MADFTLNGTAGADTLNAPGSVPSEVNGLQGNDTISLSLAADIANGNEGADVINTTTAALQSNTVNGGGGADSIDVSSTTLNTGFISGESGHDLIRATAAVTIVSSTLAGGKGNDTFRFTAATPTGIQVLAGAGNDSLSFRTNAIVNSTLKGGDNSDSIDWTLARGTNLSTNKGADTVAGATLTAASIFAGAGHDTVSVSASTNGFVNGGSGLDSINLRTGSASINGGGLADTITLSGTNMAQVIKIYGDGENVETAGTGTGGQADGADRITGGTLRSGGASIYGAGGNDTIALNGITTGSAVLLNGGNNNDSIQVGAVAANNITLAGGNGSDTIRYTSIDAASTGFITLGAGQDRVSGGLLNGSVMGGAGNDTVFINNMSASSVIDGGAHNDTIVISTTIASASTINAGDGADSITLLAGGISAGIDDREINGGAGNDSITLNSAAVGVSGAFADMATIDGGAGNDTINFNSNVISSAFVLGLNTAAGWANMIADYGSGDTLVGFSGSSFANANWIANNQIEVLQAGAVASALLTADRLGHLYVFGDNANNRTQFFMATKDTSISLMSFIIEGTDLVNTTSVGNVALTTTAFNFSLGRVSGNNGLSMSIL